jgi:ATP-dependent DNA helicase DinG
VQAIGRSVRAKDDWAYTFTIDSRFPCFCKNHARFLENFNRYERPLVEGLEFLKAPPLKKEASNKE